jgi:hybrid cluster-associated redox disulfide protein
MISMDKKTSKTSTKKITKDKINKDMTLGEVVEKYPKAVDVMMKNGLHCIGCHVAFFETVEGGAKSHGLNDTQLKKMLKEMNEALK